LTREDLSLDISLFLDRGPVLLFRIARSRYANLTGVGAASAPGRGNIRGQEAIYTSREVGVPVLERLVHTPKDLLATTMGSTVQSEVINSENVSAIEWDDGYFKYCTFEGLSMEGLLVTSDFVDCSFTAVNCYWGLFSGANFVNCSFIDCTFAGTTFPDSRFVDCSLANCRFIADNLGGNCDFSKTHINGCSVENCTGFAATPPYA
jgi:uncharacterized protein YjbI with pentapeptide repeats